MKLARISFLLLLLLTTAVPKLSAQSFHLTPQQSIGDVTMLANGNLFLKYFDGPGQFTQYVCVSPTSMLVNPGNASNPLKQIKVARNNFLSSPNGQYHYDMVTRERYLQIGPEGKVAHIDVPKTKPRSHIGARFVTDTHLYSLLMRYSYGSMNGKEKNKNRMDQEFHLHSVQHSDRKMNKVKLDLPPRFDLEWSLVGVHDEKLYFSSEKFGKSKDANTAEIVIWELNQAGQRLRKIALELPRVSGQKALMTTANSRADFPSMQYPRTEYFRKLRVRIFHEQDRIVVVGINGANGTRKHLGVIIGLYDLQGKRISCKHYPFNRPFLYQNGDASDSPQMEIFVTDEGDFLLFQNKHPDGMVFKFSPEGEKLLERFYYLKLKNWSNLPPMLMAEAIVRSGDVEKISMYGDKQVRKRPFYHAVKPYSKNMVLKVGENGQISLIRK